MSAPIPLTEALQRVCAVPCAPLPVEEVELAASLGRHLAFEVQADGPWPTTDRSAMDGFAVVAGAGGLPAGTALPVVGESRAGHPFPGELPAGSAIRIMTGAVVPPGADAVVPVEDTSGYRGETVVLAKGTAKGANIRLQGSEVRPGQVLLRKGTRIRAAEVGALAVLGHSRVKVRQRPVVAILATGDEVVPVEQTPLPHQVRESNSAALAAQVTECGAEPLRLGIAADEPGDLAARIQAGMDRADVLLTIGGVSKGTHDLVHGTLAELGTVEVFHGIALKPGKPTFFGQCRGARARFVFGLPGNPQSSFTVFDLLVAPLLRRLLGADGAPATGHAQLAGAPFRSNRRLQALPARLCADAEARWVAHLSPPSPSGDPFGLLAGDGYVLVPPEATPEATPTLPAVPYTAGLHRP